MINRTRTGALCLVVAVCAVTSGACHDPCGSDSCEERVVVAHEVDFALEDDPGVSLGFNLDDHVTRRQESEGCGHADMAGPGGEEGIDNNAARLFDAFTRINDVSISDLIRTSINDGRLLILVVLSGLDDTDKDSCVEVDLLLGSGQPFVGTDGTLTPGQTFGVAEETPTTHVSCARLEDGVLEAGPFDGELAVSILGITMNLALHDARFRAEFQADGSLDMVLGTGVEVEQLHEAFDQGNDPTLIETGGFLVDSLADLAPNEFGRCEQISATLVLSTRTAYLID